MAQELKLRLLMAGMRIVASLGGFNGVGSHILRESRAEARRGGDRENMLHRKVMSLERAKAIRELGKGGRKLALMMEEELLSILAEAWSCEWIEKLGRTSGDLFTCVEFLEVPMDNNNAERILRELVVHRKIRGHISTPVLTDILSFSESCKLQGKNFGKKLRKILS